MNKLRFVINNLLYDIPYVVRHIIPDAARRFPILLLTSLNIFTLFGTSDDALVAGVLDLAGRLLPDPPSISEAADDASYAGNREIAAADGAQSAWYLGFAQELLTPEDFGEKTYYAGGTFSRPAVMRKTKTGLCVPLREKASDIYARAAALHDGTGRGISVIAVADCIGLSNADVREIRARVAEKAGGAFTFSDITVAATHDHSSIDTQGIWTDSPRKAVQNYFSRLFLRERGKTEQGADADYMEFLYETVSDTILRACRGMESGSLTFARKDGMDDYLRFLNRSNLQTVIGEMDRFVFTPDDPQHRPTMLVHFTAHPYYTAFVRNEAQGQRGDQLSGDYVAYMGDVIEEAGYNFLFLNGSVAGSYPEPERFVNLQFNEHTERDRAMRVYGTALGRIALAMTKTQDEIFADPLLYDAEEEQEARRVYDEAVEQEIQWTAETFGETITRDNFPPFHCWYADWQPISETALSPRLDTAMREVRFKAENPLIRLIGKLGIVHYRILREGRDYYTISETGVLRFGDGKDAVTLALVPGELFPELEAGGAMLTAEGSCRKTAFGYPTIRGMFGENTVVVGLANDAIGYILPDNDYAMMLDFEAHYHEWLSLGGSTASALFEALRTFA